MNLYRDGEVVMQIVGAKPKAALLQDLDGFISSAPPTTATGTTTATGRHDHDDAAPTTAPLLRAFSPGSGDHFYTTDVAERDNAVANVGYVNEGVACQVFPAAGAGTTPLLRAFNPTSGDHFYTTSVAERDNAVAKRLPSTRASPATCSRPPAHHAAATLHQRRPLLHHLGGGRSVPTAPQRGIACHVFPSQ